MSYFDFKVIKQRTRKDTIDSLDQALKQLDERIKDYHQKYMDLVYCSGNEEQQISYLKKIANEKQQKLSMIRDGHELLTYDKDTLENERKRIEKEIKTTEDAVIKQERKVNKSNNSNIIQLERVQQLEKQLTEIKNKHHNVVMELIATKETSNKWLNRQKSISDEIESEEEVLFETQRELKKSNQASEKAQRRVKELEEILLDMGKKAEAISEEILLVKNNQKEIIRMEEGIDKNIAEMKRSVQDKESEYEKMLDEVDTLKKVVARKTYDKEMITGEKKRSEHKIEKCDNDILRLKEKIGILEKEIETEKREIAKFANKQKELIEIRSVLELNVRDLNDELTSVNSELKSIRIEIGNLEASNDLLEKKCFSLNEELKKIQIDKKKLGQTLIELKDKTFKKNEILEKNTERHNAALNSLELLKSEIATLVSKEKEDKIQLDQLSSQCLIIESEVVNTEKNKEQLIRERLELEGLIQEHEVKKEDSIHRLDCLKNDVVEANAKLLETDKKKHTVIKEIEGIEVEINTLQEQISTAVKSKEALEESYKERDVRLARLETQKKTLVQTVDELEEKSERYKSENNEKEKSIVSLESDIRRLEKELFKESKELERVARDNVEIESRSKQLIKTLRELEDKLDETTEICKLSLKRKVQLENDCKVLEGQEEELLLQKNNHQKEQEHLQEQIEYLDLRKEEKERNIIEIKRSFDMTEIAVKEMQNEFDSITSKVESTEAELSNILVEKEKLEDKYLSLNNKKNEHLSKLSESESKCELIRDDIESLKENVTGLNGAIDSILCELNNNSEKEAQLKVKRDSLKSKELEKRSYVSSLRQRSHDDVRRCDQLESEINTLETSVSELRGIKEELEISILDKDNSFHDMKVEAKRLSGEITRLTRQKVDKESKLQQLENEISSEVDSLSSLKKTLAFQEEEELKSRAILNERESVLENYLSEKSLLEIDIVNKRKSVLSLSENLEQLNGKLNKLRNDKIALESQRSTIQIENDEVSLEVKKIEFNLGSINRDIDCLLKELDEKNNRISDLKITLDENQQKLQKANDEHCTLIGDLDKVVFEIDKLEHENKEVSKKLETYEMMIAEDQATYIEKNIYLQKINQEITIESQHVGELRGKIEDIQTLRQRPDEDLENKKHLLSLLQEEKGQLVMELESLIKSSTAVETSSVENEIILAKKEILDLKGNINELRNDISKAHTEVEVKKKEEQEVCKELLGLRSEYTSLSKIYEKLRSERVQMSAMVKDGVSAQKKLEQQIVAIKVNTETLKKNNKQAKGKLAKINNKVETIPSKKRGLETKAITKTVDKDIEKLVNNRLETIGEVEVELAYKFFNANFVVEDAVSRVTVEQVKIMNGLKDVICGLSDIYDDVIKVTLVSNDKVMGIDVIGHTSLSDEKISMVAKDMREHFSSLRLGGKALTHVAQKNCDLNFKIKYVMPELPRLKSVVH